jgi:hypothetical protein
MDKSVSRLDSRKRVRIYGSAMTTATIPEPLKKQAIESVLLANLVAVGSGTVVQSKTHIAERCAIRTLSLLGTPAQTWRAYAIAPAQRLFDQTRQLVTLKSQYLWSVGKTSSKVTA